MDRLSVERVEEILVAASRVTVLVVGDLMLDRYITGRVDRISPEAPVPVVHVEAESAALGGSGNVAANVVALGAGCEIVAATGDDTEGAVLKRELESAGIGIRGLVQTPEQNTTVKTRILARRQQIVRVDRETARDLDGAIHEQLVGLIHELAPDCHAVAVEDYNKGLLALPVLEAALGRDGGHTLPVVVDPKRLRFFHFGGCTVFKPNATELSNALGDHVHPDDPGWMDATRRRLDCGNLLLTLGEDGSALSTEDGGHLRIPAVARSVYDVSGAGDTVTAVTAVCLAARASVTEAAILANHAAALEVAKTGVATVSARELLDHYRTFSNDQHTGATPHE